MDDSTADVRFAFTASNNEKHLVPAHKLILTSGSLKFQEWFDDGTSEVSIPYVSAAAFQEFLQFFYFSDVTITDENVYTVMRLGKQFEVEPRLELCDQFLKEHLSNNTICHDYEHAIELNRKKLQRYLETKIIQNARVILESDRFLHCSKLVLENILKIECFSSECGSKEVLRACVG